MKIMIIKMTEIEDRIQIKILKKELLFQDTIPEKTKIDSQNRVSIIYSNFKINNKSLSFISNNVIILKIVQVIPAIRIILKLLFRI